MELLKLKPGEAALYQDRVVVIKAVDLPNTNVRCDYADTGENVSVPVSHLKVLRSSHTDGVSGLAPAQADLAELSPEQLDQAHRKK